MQYQRENLTRETEPARPAHENASSDDSGPFSPSPKTRLDLAIERVQQAYRNAEAAAKLGDSRQ